ncbi:MAG: SpoIIE family protein phosphatase [Candidatus Wallbacteria bacterium]|nr:SpoIIE family protein phosphatase [Candidatus Wallbacteria bacterium]
MSSLREEELKIIHQFSSLMGKIFDFEELLEALVGTLSRHFQCRRVSILLIDEEGLPMIKMAQGFANDDALVKNLKLDSIGPISREVIKKKKPVIFKTKKDWSGAKIKINSNYKTFAFLAVPILYNGEVRGIINIAEPERKKTFSGEDVRMLEIISTKIGFSLETIKLHKAIVGQEVFKKELEIGRSLQLSLLPSFFPKSPHVDISVCSYPAMMVGGDYYDFLNLDENNLALAIGDISGKGVSASILMASLRALARTSVPRHGASINISLQEINEFFYTDLHETHYYSTLILGIFNFSARVFRFINAGHNYPILYRSKNKKALELTEASTHFLGFFREIPTQAAEIPIESGDIFVFFTDGLVENRSTDSVPFEEKRVMELLEQINPSQSALQIKEKILNGFRIHVKGAQLIDDYSLIVVKIL